MWSYRRGVDHVSEQPAAVIELDAALANAVAAMLQRRGCPARTVAGDDGHVVVVPRSRRSEALALVADAMEELAATVEPSQQAVATAPGDEEPRRPLLLPRLRGAGLAILLVPLLVVSLSAVSIPRRYAALLIVAAIVAIVALRTRADRDER